MYNITCENNDRSSSWLRGFAFLRVTVKVMIATQLAPSQSAFERRRHINGLNSPDAYAYGSIQIYLILFLLSLIINTFKNVGSS